MIYFTSDTHFGHSNILKYCNRPFLMEVDRKALEDNGGVWHKGYYKSREASTYRISKEATKLMDDTLIDNINKIVGEKDTLWHLGDFAFGNKDKHLEICKNYRKRIVCKDIRFIMGNHDKECIKEVFPRWFDSTSFKFNHQWFYLNHYAPIIWNKSHRGSIAIYGHSHSNAEEFLDKLLPTRRSMDVGVDNAFKLLGEYRPFSLDEILGFMKNKEGYFADHHTDPDAPTEEELMEKSVL